MSDFNFDAEAEAKKLDNKIKALQAKKAELADKAKEAKQLNELARKVGVIIIKKYEGKPFEHKDLQGALDEALTADEDRTFFGFKPLAADDPRRPKKRGRKAKS